MMIDKEMIYQIAKEHYELCSLEDKILKITKDFLDENVIWIKGKTGIRVTMANKSFNTHIEELNNNRNDREDLCCEILNIALRKNKTLVRDIFNYMLNVPHNPKERD